MSRQTCPTAVPGAARRVLVVEDEPAIRALFAQVLRRDGHEVFEAEDGYAAVTLAATVTGPIDLVVTDVVMPRLHGPDAVEAIRGRMPTLKALYVSGYTAGAELGGEPLLEKPFGVDELLAAVRDLLEG